MKNVLSSMAIVPPATTDSDEKNIIDDCDQPTAQLYYRQFLEESHIDASWDIVRWKVRYLKICFFKAEDWRKKCGADIIQGDVENGVNTVNEKLRKLCVHYDRLKDIFGKKRDSDRYALDDITSVSDPLEYGAQFDDSMSSEAYDIDKDVTSMVCNLEPGIQVDETLSASSFNEEGPISAPKTSSSSKQRSQTDKLTRCQSERNELLRMKLKFEKEKFQMELDFNKEKFYAEMKIRQEELGMKRMEIEKNERLKMLEIEKDERIAKYELALKYRSMNQN